MINVVYFCRHKSCLQFKDWHESVDKQSSSILWNNLQVQYFLMAIKLSLRLLSKINWQIFFFKTILTRLVVALYSP